MPVICKQLTDISARGKTESLPGEDDVIVCAFCLQTVTHPSRQIMINQSLHHIFVNPHGMVFEIGCFTHAQGCMTASKASNEFSWFPGYSWKIAVCRYCSTHLGWIFSSQSDFFFGLILEKLIFP